MQVSIHIWMNSLISPVLGRNGLHNRMFSYTEMWKNALTCPSLKDLGNNSVFLLMLFRAGVWPHPATFHLRSGSRARPKSSSSAFISHRRVKLRRGEEEVKLHWGAARVRGETIKSLQCQEGHDLGWVRRNSAIALLPRPARSHHSRLEQSATWNSADPSQLHF